MGVQAAWGRLPFQREQSSAEPNARSAPIYVFLIAVLSIFYLCNASVLLGHLDLGWHLAAGNLIRSQGFIPSQDPWAFTLGDKQWFNLSWLWDVLASLTVQSTGLGGLVLSVVACGAMIIALLTSACLRTGASPAAVCIPILAAGVLYPSFVTDPNTYLSASPNMATMLFCTVFYATCLRQAHLALLPLVMVFWCNLHGGFVIGFFILGVGGLAALWRRDWSSAIRFGRVGGACFAASFVNPLGWHIYAGVAATLGHFVQSQISEWQPYHRSMNFPESLPIIAYILAFVTLELRSKTLREIPLAARLLSWSFLLLGLYQFRYMSFFLLFSALPLALHIDQRLAETTLHSRFQKFALAAGVAGLFAVPLVFLRVQPGLALSAMFSERDAAYLRTYHAHSRVLNHWNVGGLLIYLTQGKVPVFVDGRAATAYPDELLRDYLKLVNLTFDENAWENAIEKYRIDTVLWVKAHQDLRRYLVERKGWREQYSGRFETVYVKQ